MSYRCRRIRERLAIAVLAGIATTMSACCLWRYVGVVYVGRAVASAPTTQAVSGDYRVRQYGGASVRASWPTDLVLHVDADGSLSCTGDHSVFVKDFGVSEAAIDPKHLGRWTLSTGNKEFPVGLDLVVGGVTIPSHLLRTGELFGLGISEAWGGDPDDRNTLEFLQDAPTPSN